MKELLIAKLRELDAENRILLRLVRQLAARDTQRDFDSPLHIVGEDEAVPDTLQGVLARAQVARLL